MTRASLEAAVPSGRSILVDTSVVLAYLNGSEVASEAAAVVFDEFVAAGRNPGILSVLTATETLVRPFRAGSAAVVTAEGFLGHFPGLRLVDTGYDVAREAARLRAASAPPGERPKLRTPDAIVVATALTADVDILVTNDAGLRAILAQLLPTFAVCHLEDHVPI